MINKPIIRNELILNRWCTYMYGGLFVLFSIFAATVSNSHTNMGPDLPQANQGVWLLGITQFGALLAILLAAPRFAKEFEGKSISFLLTRPVDRKVIYQSFFLAGILELVVVTGIAQLVFALVFLFRGGFPDLLIWFWSLPALFFIYGLALFFSLVIKKTSKTVVVTILVLVLISLFHIVNPLYLTGYNGSRETVLVKMVLVVLTCFLVKAGTWLLEKQAC